ncbi:hypothetical protein SPF06_02315 [Sinomonas sp. JGH33]|uniref:Uncharacterized protein n=1 Tax=Sinomonas terricola TaxID=3110330 RepID=A0ABU5T1M7_9MICC|nr:hypothetical protein [Sinomonas sp. JGH33]MEA5453548.1 hypothetical protein [Sinomonas sp. JGH33]
MADVESQSAESAASEAHPAGERETSATFYAAAGSRQQSKRSGITWWEACGGWNSRYALSM